MYYIYKTKLVEAKNDYVLKFNIVAMLVILYAQTVVSKQCVDIIMFISHTKLHLPSCINVSVITIKLGVKENFHKPAMLVFYVPQKCFHNKGCIISQGL
jgi:hypothetical protein